MLSNLIYGELEADVGDEITGINHKTGEKVTIKCYTKTKDRESYIEGVGYDASGKKTLEIEGSWLNEMRFRDPST